MMMFNPNLLRCVVGFIVMTNTIPSCCCTLMGTSSSTSPSTSRSEGIVMMVSGVPGDTVTLPCTVAMHLNEDFLGDRFWLFPDKSLHRWNSSSAQMDPRVTILQSNNTLIIRNAKESDSGRYFCHFENVGTSDGKFLLGRVALVVGTDEDLMNKPWITARDYRTNAIRGAIAAISTAVVLSFCCLLHKLRWKDPAVKAAKKMTKSSGNVSTAAILPPGQRASTGEEKIFTSSSTLTMDQIRHSAALKTRDLGHDNEALRLSTEDISRL